MARGLMFLLVSVLACSAYADPVYKWTDENGAVQYGSDVPDNLKGKASQVDSNKVQVIDQQHYEADRSRNSSEETSAKNNALLPASSPAESQQDAASAAGNPQVNDRKSQCEAAWARYRASLACFAPYVTARGAVKAEGFEHCEVVRQPLEICD